MRKLEERFWEKVDKSDGCWLWKASLRNGYGDIWINGHHVAAHRVAWELINGAIPEGVEVLHKCDNPPCVRPDHLFLGTVADNVRDSKNKGRRAPQDGENNPAHLLTASQVKEIKQLRGKLSQRKIGEKFGVARTTIENILTGKQWKNIK